MEKQLKSRNEIEEKDKWAIEDLYANDFLWKKDFEKLSEEIGKMENYRGRLSENGTILLEALRLDDVFSERIEKVYVYANQKLHEDTSNGIYQDLSAKAQNLSVKYSAITSYIEPELLEIPEEKWAKLFEECQGLQFYKTYLDNLLRLKTHVLSKELEELLAEAGEVAEGPGHIFSMFNNADIKFPEIEDENGESIEVTHGRYISLLESKERKVRKAAFISLYHTYEKYKNTLAAIYYANVKKEVFFAKARKYSSSLEMALDAGNIPTTVYDKLIEAVHAHMESMHKYVSIRKRMLGVEELHMYDMYVPLIQAYGGKKYSFEEAKEVVLEGLWPLGEKYRSLLKEGFEHRWIDVYENKGKRSGAYSWGAYGTHPYVLLNYQGNLSNVFTLAHEMGHSLHSYFSDEAQEYRYAGYRIFVAEVASTCNEAILMHYLIEKAETREEKAYLVNHFLEKFRATLFRQTMFAEFEKLAHHMAEEGEALSADVLCDIYYKLNEEYFGKDAAVDKEIAMEWARIPHFYNSFYVYQYATGFSAAIAVSSKILSGDEKAREGYFKFLSGGSSMHPIDLLRLCEIDMEKPEVVENALNVFENYLEQFEKLL